MKRELKIFAAMLGVFVVAYLLPLSNPKVSNAIQEAFKLLQPGVGCAEIRSRARVKVEDIRERIESLRRMENALTRLANRCRGSGPVEECPILDALDSGAAAPPSCAK